MYVYAWFCVCVCVCVGMGVGAWLCGYEAGDLVDNSS